MGRVGPVVMAWATCCCLWVSRLDRRGRAVRGLPRPSTATLVIQSFLALAAPPASTPKNRDLSAGCVTPAWSYVCLLGIRTALLETRSAYLGLPQTALKKGLWHCTPQCLDGHSVIAGSHITAAFWVQLDVQYAVKNHTGMDMDEVYSMSSCNCTAAGLYDSGTLHLNSKTQVPIQRLEPTFGPA